MTHVDFPKCKTHQKLILMFTSLLWLTSLLTLFVVCFERCFISNKVMEIHIMNIFLIYKETLHCLSSKTFYNNFGWQLYTRNGKEIGRAYNRRGAREKEGSKFQALCLLYNCNFRQKKISIYTLQIVKIINLSLLLKESLDNVSIKVQLNSYYLICKDSKQSLWWIYYFRKSLENALLNVQTRDMSLFAKMHFKYF